jgi:uncharacterized protein (TIGR00369 family)
MTDRDDRPFIDLFNRMVTEKGGWPSAPCDKGLGLRYVEIGDGVAVAEWDATAEHTIPTGTVHGGHIAAVADSVCSLAAVSTLDKKGMTAGTLTLALEFYRYTYPGLLTYRAAVSHRGRKNIFVSCDVTDADGRRIANARASLSANEPRP